MNLFRFALLNIKGSAFRSVVVTLCAVLVAGFTLATTLLLRGNEASMQMALGRLGADIVVVPMGSGSQAGTTLLTGVTTRIWMPESNVAKLAAVAGVQVASPQLYLATLTDDPCCSVPGLILMAYDPATDFTIEPWLEKNTGYELGLGEAVAGADIVIPRGQESINLFGYSLTLKSTLKTTGSGWDQSMFITFDTAREISRLSKTLPILPLDYPAAKVSSVFIKLVPGYDPQTVALDIIRSVPGVTPIKSSELFQVYRQQMSGILNGLLAILGITWVLALFFVCLIFTLAANERRRELGVLRALGASRSFVLSSLISEAGILALVGATTGIVITVFGLLVFHYALIEAIGIPFILPALPSLLTQVAIGLGATCLAVALAAAIPAYRISHQDPAVAMRE